MSMISNFVYILLPSDFTIVADNKATFFEANSYEVSPDVSTIATHHDNGSQSVDHLSPLRITWLQHRISLNRAIDLHSQ